MALPRLGPRTTVILITVTAVAAAIIVPLSLTSRSGLSVVGLEPHSAVSPSSLREARIRFDDPSRLTVTMDGEPVPVREEANGLRLEPGELDEGEHTLRVVPPRVHSILGVEPVELDFRIDTTPPSLEVQPPEPAKRGAHGEIRGIARGAVRVSAGEEHTRPDQNGRFALPVQAGKTTVTVTARDAAGNTTSDEVPLVLRHPGMRAVHMTASAWSSSALREPVMQMVREGRIDSVQLDIKDESGKIGYASQVPLAQEIGATTDLYDPRKALNVLHAEGVHVVGRLVAFRDPVLGRASWTSGHTDRLVQNSSGAPWSGGYGNYAFTNFAHPDVRAYNLALAEEAAELGFDDILYDYIRRPDGDISNMRFPGLEISPAQSIADFLAESRTVVHRHGAFQGASVFGIAASRPKQIAQDIPKMSEHVDYVAPMVYPSHWGPGEYGVADPENQPYDITARSLADFVGLAKKNGRTKVIPWLQAFSLGVSYGADEIRAQIKAAEDQGIDSFLLWNAGCRYDPTALTPT